MLLGATLVGSAACGAVAEEGGGAGSASARSGLIGNPAPDFRVRPLVGAKSSMWLKGLRGKVVLVDFWGTYCEPCKRSFPKLQELSAKYGSSGLQIVGISEDEADDKDKIPGFAGTYGAKFPLAWDEDKSIARAYMPDTMPSSYIIDRTGIVRYAHVGYHDGEELEIEKEIRGLLER
jgi:peroxiredoxin